MERILRYPLQEDDGGKKMACCCYLGGRSWKQFEAVINLTKRPGFDCALTKLSTTFAPDQKGPFDVEFQKDDGTQHVIRIGTTGKVLSEVEITA